jgi:hypothetical protein
MGQAGGTEGALPVRALPYEELLQGAAKPVGVLNLYAASSTCLF